VRRRPFALAAAAAAAVLALAPTAPRAQSAPVPAHVLTWYYYGLNDINAAVPAAVMVRYADFAEDDGFTADHAMAYKRAGGRYAAAYTDPAYVPYCYPPFSAPAGRCEGPVGNLLTRPGDESAWFHGADGTRVRRYMDPHFHYQEALNPKSPAARRAWREMGDKLVRAAPLLDFFFSDDSGGPLHTGDMSPKSSEFYNFNEAGTEIRDDAEFRDAWIAYITLAPRPLFINGYDSATGLPSYGGAWLRHPRVLGAVHESCFRTPEGLRTDTYDRWRFNADSLLANTALRRYALCFMMGTPAPANRAYALASWWLTYDPQWSVAAPIDPIPSQSALLPELDIVPREPLRTASASVRELRAESGAYVREFRACYQQRAAIGPCAAVVNPAPRPVALPPLALRYGHALALTGGDALSGGRASFSAAVPRTLAPESALLLGR
jgi:hypothetical protein